MPPREPLRGFPIRVAEWDGRATPDLDAREAGILGADEYLTRIYRQGTGEPVALFIAYYGSQRTGAVIHSPLNCLPGAGWIPVDRRRTLVDVDAAPFDEASPRGRRIEVNRVLIQKGEARQLAPFLTKGSSAQLHQLQYLCNTLAALAHHLMSQ